MTLIFCSLVYVFVDSNSEETPKIPKLPYPPTVKPRRHSSENGIEIIEISGKNASDEAPSRRIKRLDSDESDKFPDSQKLVFFPSRTLKPPRIIEKPKVINFPPVAPNHRMTSRMATDRHDPRPFNHMMGGPRPNPFQSPPKTTQRAFYQPVQNIQDIIKQNQMQQFQQQNQQRRPGRLAMPSEMEATAVQPVHLAGKYRHPRKNGDLMNLFNEQQQQQQMQHQQLYNMNAQQEVVVDPFHNYKPNSALEINQMAMNNIQKLHALNQVQTQSPYFRRKFRQQNYRKRVKDPIAAYQNALHSGKRLQDRNEEQKSKPLSMLLDIYPVAGEDGEANQMQIQQQIQQLVGGQMGRMPKLRPFQGYYQDPSMFNAMHFPQLMPRYPVQFRHPNMYQGEATSHRQVAMTKPSQLVVHLNLFPKNKGQTFKRSSMEEQMETKKYQEVVEPPKLVNNTITAGNLPLNINFNVNTGNGHPENTHHMSITRDDFRNFTTTTTDSPYKSSYYYDDNDEDMSIMVQPSLAYQNIVRDGPIHLMLKNTTSTFQQKQKQKQKQKKPKSNHRHTYQTIERPRKRKIKSEPRNSAGDEFQ